eukprot:CAMPEP_0206028434 /NCGR_PEP_ID=MMETSP1464-20131121/44937_1 /ASSEMBLY_ACC=CAM_ASM_001124 /TAXON_ID=119497 /ORGANISM="Exanthemachrysis gayraliae, Strain RCC1523" /LENGTH=225 /DNA_ID=CAMNT_0053402495 /DNA_START=7 /DNA_END=680 /DNA_ORIENTATION=-
MSAVNAYSEEEAQAVKMMQEKMGENPVDSTMANEGMEETGAEGEMTTPVEDDSIAANLKTRAAAAYKNLFESSKAEKEEGKEEAEEEEAAEEPAATKTGTWLDAATAKATGAMKDGEEEEEEEKEEEEEETKGDVEALRHGHVFPLLPEAEILHGTVTPVPRHHRRRLHPRLGLLVWPCSLGGRPAPGHLPVVAVQAGVIPRIPRPAAGVASAAVRDGVVVRRSL